jgi:hypothetical protein
MGRAILKTFIQLYPPSAAAALGITWQRLPNRPPRPPVACRREAPQIFAIQLAEPLPQRPALTGLAMLRNGALEAMEIG